MQASALDLLCMMADSGPICGPSLHDLFGVSKALIIGYIPLERERDYNALASQQV